MRAIGALCFGIALAAIVTGCSGTNLPATQDPVTGAAPSTEDSASTTGIATAYKASRSRSEVLYADDAGDSGIWAYAIDEKTGAITPLSGSPFTDSAGPSTGITVDDRDGFVYVTNNQSGNISAYVVDARTGGLTAVSGSPFAASCFPWADAVVDASGGFVYQSNNCGGNSGYPGDITAYSISTKSGALSAITGSPFGTGKTPFGVADARGRFLYAANRDTDDVSAFIINASSGALSPVSGSPFAAGDAPWGVSVDPAGRFAYVVNEGYNTGARTISGYSINSTTGALAPVTGSPFPYQGNGAFYIVVHPSGKFAYVGTNGGGGGVAAFSIDAKTGALTPISGSPYLIPGIPVGEAFAAHGKFLYVANSQNNDIAGFAVDAKTGALTALSGSPFAAGIGPQGLAVYR